MYYPAGASLGNVSDVLLKFQQLANQYNTKELTHYFPLPGNVSDVLLKSQQLINQYNTKELPCYFSLYTIEKRVFQAYKAL